MRILVAEDEPASRLLLKTTLRKWGHDVIAAEDGARAWAVLEREDALPLAILDWMMPEADGPELCRRIRATRDRKQPYIILLTAKSEKEDLIAGLDAGADDYMAKPFDRSELQARVNVAVRVAQYKETLAENQAQLELYANEMETLAQERSRQLIHSERMATVGLLSAGIAHEINNPSAFISGNAQIQDRFWEKIEPILREHLAAPGADESIGFVLEEMPKTIGGICKGVQRISKIVKGLKAFCRQEEGEKKLCDINACIAESLILCNNSLKQRVTVEQDLHDALPAVLANTQQVEQVLINLFVNAADAMESAGERTGTLKIQTVYRAPEVTITVEDNGPGIPMKNLDNIWQPFFTTKPADKGTGLGLSIVHGIIEDHQGRIAVENKPDGGARFTITLPAAKAAKEEEQTCQHTY